MGKKSLNGVLQHARMLAAVHTYRTIADSELLDRFVTRNDEAAFAVLIERHGSMLLGVCRRALGNLHDAEDGCQATFLVLARKAASIRKRTSLASWLHGVACRVAGAIKRGNQRHRRRERTPDTPLPQDTADLVSWREMQSILDEELEHLPERFRTPLILCYLDGKTRDEAAAQLGVSAGSLHSRLERGRALLRQRLTRRGLTLSATLFATVLTDSAVHAAVPPALVISSTRAGMLLAAGQTLPDGAIPAQVLSSTQEVLKTMFLSKLKLGTAALLCACLLAAVTCGSVASIGEAQDVRYISAPVHKPVATGESDEEFIRRASRDLRGSDPTSTEIHFFAASKDTGKRQRLIDLFIQERQAKKIAKEQAAHVDWVIANVGPVDKKAFGDVYRWQVQLQCPTPVPVSDEEFLRRVWLDLTGILPTVSEMQSFLKNKDPNKRAQVIDKLLSSGDPKQVNSWWTDVFLKKHQARAAGLGAMQGELIKELLASKHKDETAKITGAYLERLLLYVKDHPKNVDVADAMLQIVMVYQAQEKSVEANAWRDKLRREHPDSAAAKTVK